MGKFLALVSLFILIPCLPLFADTIHYTDGREVKAIILEENENYIKVNLYGQKVDIPRSRIKSVEKSTKEDNEELQKGWKELDQKYKEESRKAEKRVIERIKRFREDRRRQPPPGAERLPVGLPGKPDLPPLPPLARPPAEKLEKRKEAPKKKPAQLSEQQKDMLFKQEVKKSIGEKRVIPGMTEKDVRSAWGWPERTHPVQGIDKSTDRWTYRQKGVGLIDVYFENGVVIKVIK